MLSDNEIAIRLYKRFRGHIPNFSKLSNYSNQNYSLLYDNPQRRLKVGFMVNGEFNPKRLKELSEIVGNFNEEEIQKIKDLLKNKRKKENCTISEEEHLLNIINAIPIIHKYLNRRVLYYYKIADEAILKLYKEGLNVENYTKNLISLANEMGIKYNPSLKQIFENF